LLVEGCAAGDSLNKKVSKIARPYQFSLFWWEVGAVAAEIRQSITNHPSADDSEYVLAYFDAVQAGQPVTADGTSVAGMETKVAKIIQRQVRDVLNDLGIKNPLGNFLSIRFPPVTFILAEPPRILVTSPRDKIEIQQEVRLKPDVSIAQAESIESQTQDLGVSSVVLTLGGMGTFPAFVNRNSSLSDVLNTAAHEWSHHYLFFKPLGFRYALDLIGIVDDYDIVTINETVAGMFGDELEALVYEKYYNQYRPLPDATEDITPVFDFNAAMRNIRSTVDGLLAEGKIDDAEAYMETQRQFLLTKGYYIRKLNQAYFAFNGTYASEPTSVSPIGTAVKAIRTESATLKAFLNTVSGITSLDELNKIAGQKAGRRPDIKLPSAGSSKLVFQRKFQVN